MKLPNDRSSLEEDICIHIFTVSAAMVGVCLTVIGLLRVVISMRRSDTAADNIVSTDAILFLISCLSSYWALRTRSTRRMHRVEQVLDEMSVQYRGRIEDRSYRQLIDVLRLANKAARRNAMLHPGICSASRSFSST